MAGKLYIFALANVMATITVNAAINRNQTIL